MGICNQPKKKIQKINNIKEDSDYILPIEYSIRKKISLDYTMDSNFIGKGGSGEVYIARNKKGEKFAIKTINKLHIKYKESIISEVKISKNVNHKHIVKCYGVYEDLKTISFVLELIEGGDLFDFIIKFPGKHLEEILSLEILIQILETLNYLHNILKICHRDIKLENFLISIENDKPNIKIIDFGLSCYIPENNIMNEIVGSPYYQAPEILLWSTGILLYIMLLGYPPFNNEDRNKLEEQILYDNIDFDQIYNPDIRNLCQGLLEKHPDFRLNAIKALNQAYDIYEKNCNDDVWIKIRKDFKRIDNQNLGYVTFEQVKFFYKKFNINFDKYKGNNILFLSDFQDLIHGILY